MTSNWPACWLWGISYVSKRLVLSVDTILVLPFSVLWHEVLKKQDGENKRFAQHICPRALLSTTTAFNEVVTVQAQINFPPHIAYLLQIAGFSKTFLLLGAALQSLDNILALGALCLTGEGDSLLESPGLLYLLKRELIKQSCVAL